jgi:hypothetical protein
VALAKFYGKYQARVRNIRKVVHDNNIQ